ncbi:STM4013/SEN3800 family hydrolase [Streptomonospora halophila]|uniref:STM4013/SEN3800 family hydrolase n=1 Tax=Streptomonospora halophila TaxID=427369 RepID=A0ABP9GB49_9ACTN
MDADLATRDVVLVTLDSCRYDTARGAHLPALSALGPLQRAESPGTFTLPAHAAMFTGFLPRPVEGHFEIGGQRLGSIWRSAAARARPLDGGIAFRAPSLMDHYADQSYRVLGAGGVTFFDPTNPCNSLPTRFSEFRYFGRDAASPADAATRVVDREASLTLAHVDELAQACLQARRFFCFINCPCTHIPYTSPAAVLTEETTTLLERLYHLHDAKTPHPEHRPPLEATETATLRDMQRCSLEWADARLGRLFDHLAHRRPLVVVCSDHGEEFGEDGRYGHGHPHPTVTTVPLWCGLLDR